MVLLTPFWFRGTPGDGPGKKSISSVDFEIKRRRPKGKFGGRLIYGQNASSANEFSGCQSHILEGHWPEMGGCIYREWPLYYFGVTGRPEETPFWGHVRTIRSVDNQKTGQPKSLEVGQEGGVLLACPAVRCSCTPKANRNLEPGLETSIGIARNQ